MQVVGATIFVIAIIGIADGATVISAPYAISFGPGYTYFTYQGTKSVSQTLNNVTGAYDVYQYTQASTFSPCALGVATVNTTGGFISNTFSGTINHYENVTAYWNGSGFTEGGTIACNHSANYHVANFANASIVLLLYNNTGSLVSSASKQVWAEGSDTPVSGGSSWTYLIPSTPASVSLNYSVGGGLGSHVFYAKSFVYIRTLTNVTFGDAEMYACVDMGSSTLCPGAQQGSGGSGWSMSSIDVVEYRSPV